MKHCYTTNYYYYYHHHHQNLLSIELFTQEFKIILDKKGSDTLQFFNQCLSHHFAITSEVISLTNVAVIGEINKNISVLIKISDAPDNYTHYNFQSTTHTYMCNNGLEIISVCNGDWNKSAPRLVTIICCVRDLESFSVVMYCQP